MIIAIVGLCGTGKSAAVAHLHAVFSSPIIYFGGVVLAEVERRGLIINAENERVVREQLRQEHGMAAISIAAQTQISSALEQSGIAIVDGLYSFSEYEHLKNLYNADLILIAIHTNRHLRYIRMASRKVRPLTPREVDNRDLSEIKHLEKGGAIAIADYHIVNESTLDELKSKLNLVVLDIQIYLSR